MADRQIIEMLKRYVMLLNTEGLSVSKAFLYGSYATGTSTKESDIDVLIVSEKYDENDDKAVGKTWRLTRKINTKIEPFLIGIERFNSDNDSPLIYTVKQNGIQVV
jgi:predicted nucleotidyltransferase